MFRPVPLPDSDSEDEDEDVDPLEEVIRPPVRTTLFDDGFGDIGLAGSIFRVLGTPTAETWPVSISSCWVSEWMLIRRNSSYYPTLGKLILSPVPLNLLGLSYRL
jgi:hypothetical protein